MLLLYQFHNLAVNLRLGLRRADERGIVTQIPVVDRFQCHHIKLLAHAIASDHGPCKLCGLLDVIGCPCCDRAEDQFLCCPPAGVGSDLVFQLLFAHQVVVSLLHLHCVAERTRRARNDRNFLYRGRVALHRGNQRMADLVVGYDLLLMIRKDCILFLVSSYDNFNALLQIRLCDNLSSAADSPQSSLVDDICKLCTRSTGGHAGDLLKVNPIRQLDLLAVYLQNGFAPLQIGELYRNTPVKAPRTGQCRVQAVRLVGGRENDNAIVSFKSVHLGQQLVQSLFALIVASVLATTLFPDRIDFIDKHNTRSLFLGLFKQVTYLRSTHTDKHLHEL